MKSYYNFKWKLQPSGFGEARPQTSENNFKPQTIMQRHMVDFFWQSF